METYQQTEKNTAQNGGGKVQYQAKSVGYRSYTEWDVKGALYDALSEADDGTSNLIKVGLLPKFVTDKTGIEGDFYVYRNHSYENMVSEEQAIAEGRYNKKSHYHDLGVDKMTEAIMALENPIVSIAGKTKDGNPSRIMVLPVDGKNNAPLYAVLSFYSNKPINRDYSRKPHIVLTIAERSLHEDGGRTGLVEMIDNAVSDGRIISYDKTMRDHPTVNTKTTSLGIVSEKSLTANLARFQKEINTFKENNSIRYQQRSETVTNREILANALESATKTDAERSNLQKYRDDIQLIEEQEAKLKDLKSQIRELSFGKGPRDQKKIDALRFEAKQTENRINTLDKRLLKLEATDSLKALLEREKAAAYKKASEKSRAAAKQRNERPAVSARDLNKFLGVETPYHKCSPISWGRGHQNRAPLICQTKARACGKANRHTSNLEVWRGFCHSVAVLCNLSSRPV